MGYLNHSSLHTPNDQRRFMNTLQRPQSPSLTPEATPSAMNRRDFFGSLGVLAATALGSFRAEAQNVAASTPTTTTTTPVKFTPQNSVDVSVLYLGQGQLTFRSDNTPVTIDKNQQDPYQKPVVAPLLAISEGTFTQALAIGLDAIRRENKGQFPAGAAFRLVVSYQEKGEAPVEKQFPLPPNRIPTEKELDKNSVENAAALCRDAYTYFNENLCVNVKQYGPDHLQSSFALLKRHKTPVRVYILMDLPQPTGTAAATNSPAQKVP